MAFWLRLSLRLGIPLFECMARIGSYEFGLWKMHDKHDPIGNEFWNHHFGTNTAVVTNAIHATIPKALGHSRPKPYRSEDFYPVRKPSGDGLTDEQREHLKKKHAKKKSTRKEK